MTTKNNTRARTHDVIWACVLININKPPYIISISSYHIPLKKTKKKVAIELIPFFLL